MSDLQIAPQLILKEKSEAVKVLVVDDDADIIDLMKAILDPTCYTVLTANSVQGGLELMKTFQPDVIVVDMLMRTGHLGILRQIRSFSEVPVLVLSAISSPRIIAWALNNGADDYLTKPMKSSMLIAHVNKLARRGRAERDAHLGKGILRL